MLFYFGQDTLTASLALKISDGTLKGGWSTDTRERIQQNAKSVQKIADNAGAVYGINTGFGPLCTTKISKEETRTLQEKILMSHSVGVGEPLTERLVKIMLVLKLQSLSFGYSGVRMELLERLYWMLQNGFIPVVPSQGSVGASGDLAPLAHLFLPLIGMGKVAYQNRVYEANHAWQKASLAPLSLAPKEGLALINGTQFIAAHAVCLLDNFHNLLSHADLLGAVMTDALQGSVKPFAPELHCLRPHPGAQHVAYRLSALLKDSEIVTSHALCERVQDPYSIRCMPQVHGTSRAAWLQLKETLQTELNSVTDNPVVFDEKNTISGGNFHGQPLALPIDYACLALSELGNISDRRIYLSLLGDRGIPKLLMEKTGLNSGFMMLQYTAAALASENKTLCFPASADSIPTSLGQEDHVSMGAHGARKALKVAENTFNILAIELLCAYQAIQFRRPLRSSTILESTFQIIGQHIPFIKEDIYFSPLIEKAALLIRSRELLNPTQNLKSSQHELFEIY